MTEPTCRQCGKQISRDRHCTSYAMCDDCLNMESWMRTVGSWLAGIAVSAAIVGICVLGHKTGLCRCRYAARADTTNAVYRTGGSSMIQFMVNPAHSWHPMNVNHVRHR